MKIAPMSVTYVDHMGTDLNVVNAARVSFDKVSTEFTEADKKLISYLARHGHWTPFAHTSITVRIKAPIFVARQLVKHQIGLVWNEVSRRYVDSDPEFWVPSEWRERAEHIKQGSSLKTIANNSLYISCLMDTTEECLSTYNALLSAGIAPEMARIVLPLNTMTEWVWTGNVMAFSRVYNLRMDPHAQKECRDAVAPFSEIIEPLFPVSWAALTNKV